MTTRHTSAAPRLGGKLAVVLFIITLLAFVVESQLTQYVQTSLGYRKPFFLFYVVHSTFSIIFPLHLLYLRLVHSASCSSLWKSLSAAIRDHLSSAQGSGSDTAKFPHLLFLRLAFACTAGITLPALLWFAAISLATISDVTAIWNTNAFFAYLITVKLFRLKWNPRRLLAVLLATIGVIFVVYSGSKSDDNQSSRRMNTSNILSLNIKPSAPLVGDLLTLIASITYGLYQVLYKMYASLPTDAEGVSEHMYGHITSEETVSTEHEALFGATDADNENTMPPPFGLYANLLTTCIGLLTLTTLWLPIPFLHYFNIEPFLAPSGVRTILAIAGIALSGVIYNAGFMVLLGIWGPIITSVGNLLTIVLVSISDLLFGVGSESLTSWSFFGCSIIVTAFSVLAYDMFNQGS